MRTKWALAAAERWAVVVGAASKNRRQLAYEEDGAASEQ